MNITLVSSISFACLSIACGSSPSNQSNPVIVELPAKNIADSSVPKKAVATFSYDLKTPNHSWRLPDPLVEVSGNTWVDKDHLILIEDLNPNLYLVKMGEKEATLEKTIPFADPKKDKTDIEDVAYVNNTVYALWSHGVLFKITGWNDKPQVEKIKTFLSKDNNTEGLCYDPVTRQLLVACKDYSNLPNEKKSTRAVYPFDMTSNKLLETPFLIIHKKDFGSENDQKVDFFPSAIAIHPVSHDIYLLSTRENKCMAVYSHNGKFKTIQFIDKELMPQPEGICFSPEGKLYISSEGKKGAPGNLFEFDVVQAK
jgi:uncharacterized protein YjiK